MYAYEVDGLGHTLTDFDDPNLPSLLAIPLLGYDQYNHQVCVCVSEISTIVLQSYHCG